MCERNWTGKTVFGALTLRERVHSTCYETSRHILSFGVESCLLHKTSSIFRLEVSRCTMMYLVGPCGGLICLRSKKKSDTTSTKKNKCCEREGLWFEFSLFVKPTSS